MKVKAIETGYYNNKRWKPGQEFSLSAKEDFSPKWMESLEANWDAEVKAPAPAKKPTKSKKAEQVAQ